MRTKDEARALLARATHGTCDWHPSVFACGGFLDADARLFAAAPRLLAALVAKLESAERERDEAIEERKVARDDAARAAAMLAARTMERDEARAERDARPEITAEDAAAFVWYHDAPGACLSSERHAAEDVLDTLRAHAGKVVPRG